MFQLCVVPHSDNQNLPSIVFTFRSDERAIRVQNEIADAMTSGQDKPLTLLDDFGYRAVIRVEDIFHVLLINLEQAEECRLETNLHTARTGKKLMERVAKNPDESSIINFMKAQKPNGHSSPYPTSSIIQ